MTYWTMTQVIALRATTNAQHINSINEEDSFQFVKYSRMQFCFTGFAWFVENGFGSEVSQMISYLHYLIVVKNGHVHYKDDVFLRNRNIYNIAENGSVHLTLECSKITLPFL